MQLSCTHFSIAEPAAQYSTLHQAINELDAASQQVLQLHYFHLLALSLAAAIVFCGYQFLTATTAEQSYWGVWLLLAFQAQMGTKIWIWLEMNRSSTMREIKRLKLAVAQLKTMRSA